jgi:hypothetical protein
MLPIILDIVTLRAAYASGLTPLEVVEEVIVRRAASADPRSSSPRSPTTCCARRPER